MKLLRAVRQLIAGSLSRKLVLAVLVVYVVLTALLAGPLIIRERDALEEHRLARAEGVATLLAASGAHWMLSEDLAGLSELVDTAATVRAVRYAMYVTATGRVLAHTDETRIGGFVPYADLGNGPPTLRLIARTRLSIDVAAPVRVNGRVAGWAWVSVSMADLAEHQRELAIGVLKYSAIAIIIGLLIALLAARGVTRRLADLAYATDRFRLGERTVRVIERGSDEVAAAARGVNAMFEAVADGERSLKDAQRIALLGTWRYDPDAPYLEWSEAVYEIFGLDPKGPRPTFDQFVQSLPDDQKTIIRELVDEEDAREISSFNLTINRPDGSSRICWVEARSETSPATGKRVLAGICQDITDREASAEQLRQSQKMEAVGQLTGGLAHDFNNLLAIIIGNLDLLEEGASPEEVHELAGEALAAALRGSELTKQLLAFSRRQPLAPQTVELNTLISGMATLWRRTVGNAIDVRISLAENLWLTTADPSQVESAILNLVINARDAMPEGGVLTVETRNQKFDEQSRGSGVGDDELVGGDYSVITVSDTGLGMPPETVARAFEPFFTTKPQGQGTGLGLSMIYGFARQSGGHVRIYSEPGHGTAVSIYLPRAAENAQSPRQRFDPASQVRSEGETVLLVEDEEGVRRTVGRHLKDLGYKVIAAGTGPEALELLGQNPQVDLLFTDIVMPGGMNGVELSEIVRRKHPNVCILHTSGFTKAAAGALGSNAATTPLLTKPYRKADLAASLRRVLDAPVSVNAG